MSSISFLLIPVLFLGAECMPPPTPVSRRFQYTAPPLVIKRRDNGFVYDAKEDWWAYLCGLIGLSVGLIILVYILYTYDIMKLCRKEDPLIHDYAQHASYSKTAI